MKKLTRLGAIVFIVGISLLLTTIYRGNSEAKFGGFHMLGTPSEGFIFDSRYLFPPQTCQIRLNASSEVDVYILDEEGITLWEEDKILEPLWKSSGAKQHIGRFEIKKRGEYALLMFNIYNASTTTRETISFSGLENDLLEASITITAAGLTIVAASILLKNYRVRREHQSVH